MRLFLEYHEGSVQLPPGETIIGRDVGCSLRFNDPFVSRRHVRIVFEDDTAHVEELASRNGTWLNDEPLVGRQPLADGDSLRLGKRTLRVLWVQGEAAEAAAETTQPDYPELAAGLLAIDDAIRDLESPPTQPAPPPAQTCPACRSAVAAIHDVCPHCGHEFRAGRPASLTQQIPLGEVDAMVAEAEAEAERRSATRQPLAIPVVYTSETMTIDAITWDLSRSGVFIASLLLDEVGTKCQVTLLPEAAPAIPIASVVARVTEEGEPGMGIRFHEPSERVRRWLEAVLDR